MLLFPHLLVCQQKRLKQSHKTKVYGVFQPTILRNGVFTRVPAMLVLPALYSVVCRAIRIYRA